MKFSLLIGIAALGWVGCVTPSSTQKSTATVKIAKITSVQADATFDKTWVVIDKGRVTTNYVTAISERPGRMGLVGKRVELDSKGNTWQELWLCVRVESVPRPQCHQAQWNGPGGPNEANQPEPPDPAQSEAQP